MAERRMFAKKIIDSDMFLDMPISTQLLYFHLAMRADDDGFVNNPKKIKRMIGCACEDLKMLISKQLIIPFDSGIVVIKHWRIHNYIRADRYSPSSNEERDLVTVDDNMVYQLSTTRYTSGIPSDIPVVYQPVDKRSTQVRLGKDRLDKDSLVKDSLGGAGGIDNSPPAPAQERKRFVKPSIDDVVAYCAERGNTVNADKFIDYYESKGWLVGKSPMKDWKAAVRNWERTSYGNSKQTEPDIPEEYLKI